MKLYLSSIILFLLILFAGCDNDNIDKDKNEGVESYIKKLKAEQYNEMYLPAFTCADIPALLGYRESDITIRDFPRNPISSFYFEECRLGIYVLWTIESIRQAAIDTDRHFMGFPSLNPMLGNRNGLEFPPANLDQAHDTAAEAYYRWWYDNKGKPFDEFKNIDPLSETDYQWH